MKDIFSNKVKFKFNFGFTLVEVLVVIVVIGVVASLSLSLFLTSATGYKEQITRVRKAYTTLADAYEKAQLSHDEADGWASMAESNGEDASKFFADKMVEFLSISKQKDNVVLLFDGMQVTFKMNKYASESIYYSGYRYLGSIVVDVDGPEKGKNQYGKDKFIFDVTDKGIYPEGISDEDLTEQCFGHGYCTKWLIKNDSMDYLKADRTGLCENGTKLSWTNKSCG